MWTMLAGVPGKLKTVLDRLTSTRAANLDNLNATITSRAQASTAVSNTVLTDERIANLDLIEPQPTNMAPIASGLVGDSRTLPAINEALAPLTPHKAAGSSSVGTTTFVNVTGKGVVTLAGLRIGTAGSGGQEITARFRLTIDGVAHETLASTALSSFNQTEWMIGFVSTTQGSALDQVPFNESLTAALIVDSRSGGGNAAAYVAYRRVA